MSVTLACTLFIFDLTSNSTFEKLKRLMSNMFSKFQEFCYVAAFTDYILFNRLNSEYTIAPGTGTASEQDDACTSLGGQAIAADVEASMQCVIKGDYSVLEVLCPTRTSTSQSSTCADADKGCLDFYRATRTDSSYSITDTCTAIGGTSMGNFKCIVPGTYTIFTTYFSDVFYANVTDTCSEIGGYTVSDNHCVVAGAWTIAASEMTNSDWSTITVDNNACINLNGYFVTFFRIDTDFNQIIFSSACLKF